ncbi:hypothetical protein C0J52_25845 [Blattella germanica]|nr:hypothetical protein C0J52_25845 [Blattella germanica]
MADNTSSNGDLKFSLDSSGVGDSDINTTQQDYTSTMKSATGEMEVESAPSADKAGDYVRELLHEKQSLDSSQWPNALRLLDQGMVEMFQFCMLHIGEVIYVTLVHS